MIPKPTKPATNAASHDSTNASAASKKTTTRVRLAESTAVDSPAVNIAEILDAEYRGISLYAVAMMVLVVAILWTGIKVVEQIQDYHQRYGTLLKLKRDFRQLQIEHQRMLIEQQTFSATPQVTNRAVAELNMFYPNLSDRMILHTNQAHGAAKPSDASSPNQVATAITDQTAIDTPAASAVQP